MSCTISKRKSNYRSTERYIPTPANKALPAPDYGAPYVVVSPILVPYIHAPVNISRGKSRKGKKFSVPIRREIKYVPALTYATLPPSCGFYESAASPATYPYSFPVASYGTTYERSYCSLPSNNSYHSESPNSITKHELNPLSRPYTPSNRVNKVDSDSCILSDNTDDEHDSTGYSCSASRQGSPTILSCPYCRGKTSENISDVDSGVGGESDDEGWCSCEVDIDDTEDWLDELYVRLRTVLRYNLVRSTTALLDFLCANLAPHEWRAVARELGINDVVIQNADYEDFENVQQEMRSVFAFWAKSKQSCSFQQKYQAVERSLIEIGRSDLVGQIQTNRHAIEVA